MIRWNFTPYKEPSQPGLYSTVANRELEEFTDILIRKSKIEPDSFESWLDSLEITEIENDNNGFHVMPLQSPVGLIYAMRFTYDDKDEKDAEN